jgi:hypothetical protein
VRRPQRRFFEDNTPYSSCCKRSSAVIKCKIIILRFAHGCSLRLSALLSTSGADDNKARLQNQNLIIVPVVEPFLRSNETVLQG